MHQEKKISTSFHPSPFNVLNKEDNSVVVESQNRNQYKRNVTHVKPFNERVIVSQYPNSNIVDKCKINHSDAVSKEINEREKVQCTPNKSVQENSLESTVNSRPSRLCELPDKLNDCFELFSFDKLFRERYS